MEKGLSDQQEFLLLKACRNGGVFSIELARRVYSSNNSAKSAVQKLEVLNFIENTSPGHFKVVKVTPWVERQLEDSESEESSDSVTNASSSGSDFVKEPASP